MPEEPVLERTVVPGLKRRPREELRAPESGEREAKVPTFVPVDLKSAIEALKPEKYLRKLQTKSEEYLDKHPEKDQERPLVPKLLAEGGEHLVFEFNDPRHRNIVYKVNFHQTLPLLEGGLIHADEREAAEDKLREQIKHRKKQVEILRGYFGHDAVPVQRLLVHEVPISREVIRMIRPSAVPAGEIPETIPAWVSIQRRLAIQPERTVMLQGYYPETSTTHPDKKREKKASALYDKGHDLLVGRAGDLMPHEEQVKTAIGMYPRLEAIRRRLSDPYFRTAIQKTAKNLVDFTEQTSIPLDVVGKNNIFLFRKDKWWEVKMPDALYPELELQISDLSKFAEALTRGESLVGLDAVRAINLLNTVRYVNALAIVAGIQDRVSIPRLKDVPGYVWREALVKKPRQSSDRAAAFEKTTLRPEASEQEVPW